jgi:hypothetical protein
MWRTSFPACGSEGMVATGDPILEGWCDDHHVCTGVNVAIAHVFLSSKGAEEKIQRYMHDIKLILIRLKNKGEEGYRTKAVRKMQWCNANVLIDTYKDFIGYVKFKDLVEKYREEFEGLDSQMQNVRKECLDNNKPLLSQINKVMESMNNFEEDTDDYAHDLGLLHKDTFHTKLMNPRNPEYPPDKHDLLRPVPIMKVMLARRLNNRDVSTKDILPAPTTKSKNSKHVHRFTELYPDEYD